MTGSTGVNIRAMRINMCAYVCVLTVIAVSIAVGAAPDGFPRVPRARGGVCDEGWGPPGDCDRVWRTLYVPRDTCEEFACHALESRDVAPDDAALDDASQGSAVSIGVCADGRQFCRVVGWFFTGSASAACTSASTPTPDFWC